MSNWRSIVRGAGLCGLLCALAACFAAPANAEFGVVPGSFTANTYDESGSPDTVAAAHPFEASSSFEYNRSPRSQAGIPLADENAKDIVVDLPVGLYGDPQATPTCTFTRLAVQPNGSRASACPIDSQVGVVELNLLFNIFEAKETTPVYNMEPHRGELAAFGFLANGVPIRAVVSLRPDDHGVRVTVPEINSTLILFGQRLTIWGVPADESHRALRDLVRTCLVAGGVEQCLPQAPGNKESTVPPRPFLTNPADCTHGPYKTLLATDSWQQPAIVKHYEAETETGVKGCDALRFEPSMSASATGTRTDGPTGLNVSLKFPYNRDPAGLGVPPLRDAKITLPEGMTINPASAGGLGACSDGQLSLGTDEPVTCPDAAKVGTVTASSPVIEQPLTGAVYLRSQASSDPESGEMFRLALVLEEPERGLLIKLPGAVRANSATGRIVTEFNDNPQLPVESIDFSLKSGPRAPLALPLECGAKTIGARLTSWAGQTVDLHDSVDVACSGTSDFSPAFTAGTTNLLAGASSPFVLALDRDEGQQALAGLEVYLPAGLVASLRGIPYCADGSIAAAAGRSGREELASPSCPAASQVGTVDVAAGSGTPFGVRGRAYLAGPYKGAPLSLAIVTPAVAGPYDLGTIVVRTALQVDPVTAEVSAISDRLPQIAAGVPLRLRSLDVNLDRAEFTRNPTNCSPAGIGSTITGADGAVVTPSSRFQVAECAALPFKPQISLSLKGATNRTGHPALKAVVTYPKQGTYANIARAQVNLPHGEFLDQGNLNKTCTRPVLMAGNCPKSSVYGHARAWTPLLDHPLEGYVYLVGGYGYKLPALVADLNGQIRVTLVGKVDSGKNKGIRNTFEVVPDAPVSRFELRMKGGRKYGLLENSEDLCKAKKASRRAIVRFTGQNGKVSQWKPVVANQCGKGKRKHKEKAGHQRSRHGGQGKGSKG